MAVLDASVLVAYLGGADYAPAARDRIQQPDGPHWAPHLIDAEVGHALRRAVRLRALSAEAARAALDDLAELPLMRAAHTPLLGRAFELRDNASFYDGLYIALAERLETTLVTTDARLAGAPGVRARIDVLSGT